MRVWWKLRFYLQTTEGILHPLGRNLPIGTLAAILLLASPPRHNCGTGRAAYYTGKIPKFPRRG